MTDEQLLELFDLQQKWQECQKDLRQIKWICDDCKRHKGCVIFPDAFRLSDSTIRAIIDDVTHLVEVQERAARKAFDYELMKYPRMDIEFKITGMDVEYEKGHAEPVEASEP